MDIEQLREYCLSKAGTSESLPFDEVTLVFKVMGKIFALIAMDAHPPSINLKCYPDKALELRASYPSILPGYHMNKTHWNTVIADSSISDTLIKELIDHSYYLVAQKLKKADKQIIGFEDNK